MNNWARVSAAAAASFALLLAPAVGAIEEADFQLTTTQDLYDLCSVPEESPGYVAAIYACRGYIHAAVDYHDAVTDRKNL